MFSLNFLKKFFREGGERKMKLLTILFAAALIMALPVLAKADIGLTVNASVTSGTALGPHILLKCTGYNYNTSGDPFTQCQNMQTQTSMNFGVLSSRLLTTAGQDNGAAGCFYATNFYIVYLFPDAWGGKGYDLKQNPGTFSSEIQNSVVMTPVYSSSDKYSGQAAQGDLNPAGITGEVLGNAILAKDGGSILKARRPRIVRAEFGIPPFPKVGEARPATWKEVLLTTPAGTSYSGSVTITLTELQ